MMDRSDAPAIAALVACPARSECPAYPAESRFTFSLSSGGNGRREFLLCGRHLGQHCECFCLSAPQNVDGGLEYDPLLLREPDLQSLGGLCRYTLAYLAGHRVFSTTRRYVHPNLNTAREALERARNAQGGHKNGHSQETVTGSKSAAIRAIAWI